MIHKLDISGTTTFDDEPCGWVGKGYETGDSLLSWSSNTGGV